MTGHQWLDLDEKGLTSLPANIGNLTDLEKLTTRGNRIVAVPEALGCLTGLRDLRLGKNLLTSVPEAL